MKEKDEGEGKDYQPNYDYTQVTDFNRLLFNRYLILLKIMK